MEYFGKLALHLAVPKPLLWFRYVGDLQGSEWLQVSLNHHGTLRSIILSTMEIESGILIPFLDVLFIR
jgi:hypothetical protein